MFGSKKWGQKENLKKYGQTQYWDESEGKNEVVPNKFEYDLCVLFIVKFVVFVSICTGWIEPTFSIP